MVFKICIKLHPIKMEIELKFKLQDMRSSKMETLELTYAQLPTLDPTPTCSKRASGVR